MRLVSILSAAENDEIKKLIEGAGKQHQKVFQIHNGNFITSIISKTDLKTEKFWTSGTNFGNRGIFYWMGNGRPVIYNDWQPGEPGDLTTNEDCVELTDYYGNMKWNDAPWYQQKYFICEQQYVVE